METPTLYSARWVLPISSPPIEDGAIAITESHIGAVGTRVALQASFPSAVLKDFGAAAILPGLINAHSHLELTALRGFLESEEGDFFRWLKKLTFARLELMTRDDIHVSAQWGACEALRAGVTCVGDASDAAYESLTALREVGMRGTVFQESFGPDPKLAAENFAKLREKVFRLRALETGLVKVGVSPHAPYSVCAPQLRLISEFALSEQLPLMMHAAESRAEELLVREGLGAFADGLASRNIEWSAPGISIIEYLKRQGVLETKPLLAHCILIDASDVETIKRTGTRVAHCPKSNAKLGHGKAPLLALMEREVPVGLGSDSVASNNTCDLLEEARFAVLLARMNRSECADPKMLSATEALYTATIGGARALSLESQVGELREGAQADFAVIALTGTHQLPSYDPANTLIFASSGRDVILTVVAGRELYREGQITTVDEERLRGRMQEISMKLRSRG